MNEAASTWLAIIGVGGGGAVLLEIIRGLSKFISGASGRERLRNTNLTTQRNEAWTKVKEEQERADAADARADREARNRRKTEEYASQLRRDCTEHGMSDQELRPWPVLETNTQERG